MALARASDRLRSRARSADRPGLGRCCVSDRRQLEAVFVVERADVPRIETAGRETGSHAGSRHEMHGVTGDRGQRLDRRRGGPTEVVPTEFSGQDREIDEGDDRHVGRLEGKGGVGVDVAIDGPHDQVGGSVDAGEGLDRPQSDASEARRVGRDEGGVDDPVRQFPSAHLTRLCRFAINPFGCRRCS